MDVNMIAVNTAGFISFKCLPGSWPVTAYQKAHQMCNVDEAAVIASLWVPLFQGMIFVTWVPNSKQLMENHFGGKNLYPENEAERLKAVKKCLDIIPNGYFANLANIMARTFNTPIELVSFVVNEEVMFTGNYGMESTKKVSRGLSLCSLAILNDQTTVFADALKEPCLLANPLVTGSFGLRFYAGAPIITQDGYAIGTACIVDKEVRTFTKEDVALLEYFARVAMQEVEIRYKMLERTSAA
jgi:GAF domain-containing protein